MRILGAITAGTLPELGACVQACFPTTLDAACLNAFPSRMPFVTHDAVLAASIFHFGTFTIDQAKEYLKGKGIPVRPKY